MNDPCPKSIRDELHRMDQQIQKRNLLGTIAYATGLLAVVALMYLPFDLSRIGSVVLIVALGYMISRLHVFGRRDVPSESDCPGGCLRRQLDRLNAQIDLGQSPF